MVDDESDMQAHMDGARQTFTKSHRGLTWIVSICVTFITFDDDDKVEGEADAIVLIKWNSSNQRARVFLVAFFDASGFLRRVGVVSRGRGGVVSSLSRFSRSLHGTALSISDVR